MATEVGGPTPKETPYARLTNFRAVGNYTVSIKRSNSTRAAGWFNSQDYQADMNPIFVYNGDVLDINVKGPAATQVYFTIQRLNSGSWVDSTNITVDHFARHRRIQLTIGGTAATSTVTVTG